LETKRRATIAGSEQKLRLKNSNKDYIFSFYGFMEGKLNNMQNKFDIKKSECAGLQKSLVFEIWFKNLLNVVKVESLIGPLNP